MAQPYPSQTLVSCMWAAGLSQSAQLPDLHLTSYTNKTSHATLSLHVCWRPTRAQAVFSSPLSLNTVHHHHHIVTGLPWSPAPPTPLLTPTLPDLGGLPSPWLSRLPLPEVLISEFQSILSYLLPHARQGSILDLISTAPEARPKGVAHVTSETVSHQPGTHPVISAFHTTQPALPRKDKLPVTITGP